jgi:hypothetical protein
MALEMTARLRFRLTLSALAVVALLIVLELVVLGDPIALLGLLALALVLAAVAAVFLRQMDEISPAFGFDKMPELGSAVLGESDHKRP